MEWLGYFVGAGLSLLSVEGRYNGPDLTASVAAGASYRMNTSVAAGLHLRGARLTGRSYEQFGDHSFTEFEVSTLDVGLAAPLGRGRATFQPSVGVQLAHGSMTTTYFMAAQTKEAVSGGPRASVGLLVAVDLWARRLHRVSAYADIYFTVAGDDSVFRSSYSALTLGVAYRRF